MRILITDGNERSALAAVRSLLRAGHEVLVAASTRLSLAGASRGVQPRLLSTDPLMDPGAYASEVGRIAREDGSALVLPMTDASVEALLEHRKVLPAGVALPFPDLATYRAASDKAHVLGLARGCGFGVPETRIIAASGELDASPPDAAFFPAIVKPHRSVVAVGAGRRKVAVTPVADSTACRHALAALPPSAFPVLLEQRIAGAGEGGSTPLGRSDGCPVCSSPLAREAARRRRQRLSGEHPARSGAGRSRTPLARRTRLGGCGHDRVQARANDRPLRTHGGERPVLGFAPAGHRRRSGFPRAARTLRRWGGCAGMPPVPRWHPESLVLGGRGPLVSPTPSLAGGPAAEQRCGFAAPGTARLPARSPRARPLRNLALE